MGQPKMPEIACLYCGNPTTFEEIVKSRFCENCGKFFTTHDLKKMREIHTAKKEFIGEEPGTVSDIKRAYSKIRRIVSDPNLIDPLNVVSKVEEYRQFWKPRQVKVILLAESHVYTTASDYKARLSSSILKRVMPSSSGEYPKDFVRFVYCLGYGENRLLTRKIEKNQGTWQFWKIFCYCTGLNEDTVKKTRNPFFERRLRSKINVLNRMKEKGVWLLDASIVGLYKSGIKNNPKLMRCILQTSWHEYVEKIVLNSNPKHVIVIGKAVGEAVIHSINKLSYTLVNAPQAHVTPNYQIYREICNRYV
jgi:hypothetical protein